MIGIPFLVQRALQQIRVLLKPQQVRVRAGAAVACHFVVLHALRGGDQRSVEDVGVLELVHCLLAFLEQSFHALALFAFRRYAEIVEDALEPLYLLLRLLIVLLEGALQLGVRGLLRHFRKRLEDLIFSAEEIAQLFEVEFLE